jgi:hypothetical protein
LNCYQFWRLCMFLKRFGLLCVVLSAAVWLTACGGSSKPLSITITPSASTVDGGDTVTLHAAVTNDKNSAGVSWTVTGGGTLSGQTTTSATFTAPAATSSAQTITITATSVAEATKTVPITLTVPAKPLITTTAPNLAGTVGTTYSVTLAGSGGIAPYTWKLDSTSATLPSCLGMTLAGVISGTPVASCAGTYAMVFDLTDSGTPTPLTATVTVNLVITAAPAITFGTPPTATGTYNAAYSSAVSATGGVGTLTYSLASGALPTGMGPINPSTGAITGTPTAVGPFNFTVKAADAFGDSTTQAYTITVSKATPTLAFTPIATQTYGVTPFTVSASSASSGAVSYSVTSGPATISGNTVTITGVGPVVLGASQAASTNYTAATASTSFTVSQETPTLVFATIPSHTYGDAPFTVSATSASSGVVTYSVTSGPATISGNTVTLTGAGTVVLGASQAATTDYAVATASATFTVYAEAPTLTFTTIATQTYGVAPFTVSASSASSGAVTYSVTSGPATISGSTVTITGAGTVVLGASQAATGNYGPATASTNFTVSPKTPTLVFATIPTETYGNAAFAVSATSASNGAVTYSVTSGPATISGNMVTLTGVGPVVLGASQAATTDYTSATASTNFTVSQETPTLIFATIPTETYGNVPFAVSASSASSGVVTYSVTSGPATISGSTVTITGAGPVVLGASQAATTDYTTATASVNFTVYAETPTLTFTAIPTQTYSTTPISVSATSASSGAVTYSVTGGPATISGNMVTLTGVGTVSLLASQAANGNYAATTTTTNFTVIPGPATHFLVSAPSTAGTGVAFNFTVTAQDQYGNTATGYMGTVSFTSTDGAASLPSSSTLNSGTKVFQATLNTVSPPSQTITATDTVNSIAGTSSAITVSTLSITPTTLSPSYAITGSSYSTTLAASGGSGSYTWSVTLGATGTNSLASVGLSLSNGGVLSGTASLLIAGTATFTVKATDANNASLSATQQYTITVYAPLAVNSSALGSSTNVNQSYNGHITASGGSGTYTWMVTSLPYNMGSSYDGLSFTINNNTLTVVGTPTTAQTVTFTAKVTDSLNNVVGPNTYTITVNPVATLTVSLYSVPQGMVGMPYIFNGVSYSGGTSPYFITYTNAPSWASEDSNSNLVGTPTSSGTTTVTVKVTDSTTPTPQFGTTTFSLPVVPETAAYHNGYLTGQYACYIKKYWDGGVTGGNGSTLYQGGAVFAIKVDGSGSITGGEVDENTPNSGYSSASANGAIGGSYAVGADNRGYLLLTFGSSGSGGVLALAGGDLNSSSQFSEFAITEMDDAGTDPSGQHGSGHCYKQITTPSLSGTLPSGGYVFSLTGEDSGGSSESIVGSLMFTAGATTGTLSGVQDMVDNVTVTSDMSVSGTNTTADSYGRMEMTIGPSGQQGANATVAYLTNNTKGEAVLMGEQSHNGTNAADFIIGEVRKQVAANIAASYPFTGAGMLYAEGTNNNSGSPAYKAMVFQITGDSSAQTITINSSIKSNGGTFTQDDPGDLSTIAYTTDPTTGRVALIKSGKGGGVYFYLYDTNSAAALMGDGTTPENLVGWIEPQTAPTSGTWAIGDFATSYFMSKIENGDHNNDSQTSVLTLDSSGNINDYAEDDGGSNWASWDEGIAGNSGTPETGAFALDTTDGTYGLFDVNFTSGTTTTTQSYCFAISVDAATNSSAKGKLVCMDIGSNSPKLSIAQE